MSGATLQEALDRAELEERRAALRALLANPLLRAESDPARFALVRRHADWLRAWLARETGWALRVDSDFARLSKWTTRHSDATRGALARPSKQPFGRRRYVLLALALAALERCDRQVALGRLAEDVLAAAADPRLAAAGLSFTLGSRDERADLVAAVRLLTDHGVLVRIDGDEQAFVDRRGDCLYDVDRAVLAVLPASQRPPSARREEETAEQGAAERLEGRLRWLVDEPLLETEAARVDAARRSLQRRLLDEPVVLDEQLDESERAYLQTQRAAVARRLAEATGLEPELRAEGMALLDRHGDATDLVMPEEGTDGHAALLLAEHLAARERERPGERVPEDELERAMKTFAAEHGGRWRKSVREPGGWRPLLRGAVHRLLALGLVEEAEGGLRPLPPLARWSAGAVRVVGREEPA